MKFEYNGHLDFNERISFVAKDIKNAYSEISDVDAKKIAALEPKIINKLNFNMLFNRLYNILLVEKNNYKIFNRVYNDLMNICKNNTLDDKHIEKLSFIDKLIN